MLRLGGLIAAVLVLAGCASSPVRHAGATLAVTNVQVVDPERGVSTPGRMVIVAGDRILAVERSAPARLPPGLTVVDGGGGYLIPGLWDMHAHALSDPDDAVRRLLPLFTAHGVTGIRDMGSLLPGIRETRRRLAGDPALAAPQLYVSGPLLDGVKLPWYGELPLVLKSAEDVRAQLPAVREAGVDFFKVYDNLGPEAFAEVRTLAAQWGLPVAGHPTRSLGLQGSAAAGLRSLEHLSASTFRECADDPTGRFDRWIAARFGGDSYTAYDRVSLQWLQARDPARCRAAFEAMATAGTFFTPTLGLEMGDRSRVEQAALRYLPRGARPWCETTLARADKSDEEARRAVYRAYGAALTEMRRAGVQMLAGSDSSNNCLVPGASLHWELERLVETGFTPAEALQAATTTAAAALGRAGRQGRVAPGHVADLVLLTRDPLQDIRSTRAISAVVSQGRVRRRPELDALLAQAAAAADAERPAKP